MKRYPLPDFVKKASLQELEHDELPANLYADDRLRLYPCHTPAATVIAAAQFCEDKNQYSKERQAYIVQGLLKHASEQGIYYTVKGILEYRPPEEPIEYAWEHDGRKLFPMRNEKEASAVVDYLTQHWRKIASDVREAIARNALHILAKHRYNIGPKRTTLEKLAFAGLVDKERLLQHVKTASASIPVRKPSFEGDSYKDENWYMLLPQLQKELEHTPVYDQERLRLLCKAASQILGEIGAVKQPIELETILTPSEVNAVADTYIELPNGKMYKRADFRNLTASDLAEWFGPRFQAAIRDGVVNYDWLLKEAMFLTPQEAERVSELLAEKGVRPLSTTTVPLEVPL